MKHLNICWNIIGSEVQEMTSGLLQTFASPRRENKTFQLKRMARIFWVRKKLMRRGKNIFYFSLDGVLVFFFPLWTERFYLMDIHWEMFRKIDQIQIDCTASQMNREAFYFFFFFLLLILRLCCYKTCGAFSLPDFCGWVIAIARPHGELDQPGDPSWKLTPEENQIDFSWINGSVTHCVLWELVESRRLESGGRPSVRCKGSGMTSHFPAHTWLWNCGVTANRITRGGFLWLLFSFFCTFDFFLWFPIWYFFPVLPKDTAFCLCHILTWLTG